MIPYSGPIVSREDARAAGLKRFFTGKLCSAGHLSEGDVRDGKCIACVRDRQRRWCAENADALSAYQKRWRTNNADHKRESDRQYRNRNDDHVRLVKKRWQQGNPEKSRASRKRYYAKNREAILARRRSRPRVRKPNTEKDLAAKRRHYALNRDKVTAQQRVYYAANREIIRERVRLYYSKNKEKALICIRCRKARLRANGKFTRRDIDHLMAKQKKKCAVCFKRLTEYHVDHVQPVARGGRNDPSNLQLLCPGCNRRKHAKDPFAFARELGRLL
jgi:5-methylcytosine-specific restriction endonuclease McrA